MKRNASRLIVLGVNLLLISTLAFALLLIFEVTATFLLIIASAMFVSGFLTLGQGLGRLLEKFEDSLDIKIEDAERREVERF